MSSERSTVRRSPLLGRRLGVSVFWVLALFVVGGAARSILPALYWPAHAPEPRHPGALACAREIDELERELTSRTASGIDPELPAAPRAWLARWDARYLALGPDCGPLEDARRDLGVLRARLGALLVEHARESGPARERVRRAVDAFVTNETPGEG